MAGRSDMAFLTGAKSTRRRGFMGAKIAAPWACANGVKLYFFWRFKSR